MTHLVWIIGMICIITLSMKMWAASPQKMLREFYPGELWPDNNGNHINAHGGGMLFHKGIYYWFGEHKNPATDIANEDIDVPAAKVGFRVYSSIDLYNWKDLGIALAVSEDPTSHIRRGCIMERPKVIYNAKTGKFIMWFHLELNDANHPKYASAYAAVATADTPAGPYRFLKADRLNAKIMPIHKDATGQLVQDKIPHTPENAQFYADFEVGQMARDMSLFVDDDGSAYIIATSEENHLMHISQLTDDYLQASGTYARFNADFQKDTRGDTQNEAPAIFKRDGKYYMISSGTTGWDPNPARSFIADSIWGPWHYLGNPCRGTPKENAITFNSQPTYVLPITGRANAYIFMADRWCPANPIDGRYIWLPIDWEKNTDGLLIPIIRWHDRWTVEEYWPS